MQRNQWYVQLQSPVHIFAAQVFKRDKTWVFLPPVLSSGWMEEKLLVFHSPSPEALSGAGGTHKGEVESYNCTHCFGRERVKNSQKQQWWDWRMNTNLCGENILAELIAGKESVEVGVRIFATWKGFTCSHFKNYGVGHPHCHTHIYSEISIGSLKKIKSQTRNTV